MDQFGEKIVAINEEMMANGTVEDIIRTKLTDAYEEAIKDAFRWGDLKKAIEHRITEILVPAIENHDLNGYVVKLDDILTQVIKETALPDHKQLLENFKSIMLDTVPKEIKLSDVMDKYAEFCARNLDCSGREVDLDDEPSYAYGSAAVFVKDKTSKYCYNSGERALLVCNLEGDESEENVKNLHREISLTHCSWDNGNGFAIRYDYIGTADITSLRNLDAFDVWLIALTRNGSRLIADIDDREEDDFRPEEEPSCDFS